MIDANNVNEILNSFLFGGLPGACGGLVLYIYGHKKGHYQNNKYIAKLLIEVLGASLTAAFLISLFGNANQKIVVAFLIGMFWSNIIQGIRSRVTGIIQAAIGNELKKGN